MLKSPLSPLLMVFDQHFRTLPQLCQTKALAGRRVCPPLFPPLPPHLCEPRQEGPPWDENGPVTEPLTSDLQGEAESPRQRETQIGSGHSPHPGSQSLAVPTCRPLGSQVSSWNRSDTEPKWQPQGACLSGKLCPVQGLGPSGPWRPARPRPTGTRSHTRSWAPAPLGPHLSFSFSPCSVRQVGSPLPPTSQHNSKAADAHQGPTPRLEPRLGYKFNSSQASRRAHSSATALGPDSTHPTGAAGPQTGRRGKNHPSLRPSPVQSGIRAGKPYQSFTPPPPHSG